MVWPFYADATIVVKRRELKLAILASSPIIQVMRCPNMELTFRVAKCQIIPIVAQCHRSHIRGDVQLREHARIRARRHVVCLQDSLLRSNDELRRVRWM